MDDLNEVNTDNNYVSQMEKNVANNDININDNNNYLNNTFSTQKKYLNFSSEKNSNIKNYNINQLLDLDTETKNQNNLNNNLIYNEIINNLNDIINKLQIEDSRKEYFLLAKENFYSNIKYFLNDLINFDEQKAIKLNRDLENIKLKYDYYINNINEISKLDWVILNDLINNYNDYCIDFLKNIKNIKNLKEVILLLKININQIINNYFNYKNKQQNILLTNKKPKIFLNNKRKLEEDYINNNKNDIFNEINNGNIYNNMIIISKDEKGIFNKYTYYKYKNDNIKNIYDKNLIPKYISLSIYISKNENEDNLMQVISSIKIMFTKYVISYKNNYDDFYLKIKFCGIIEKPKNLVKTIQYLMKNLIKEKSIAKIYIFSNLKDSIYKIINQINDIENDFDNEKSLYSYYTTNINMPYLKQFIYN